MKVCLFKNVFEICVETPKSANLTMPSSLSKIFPFKYILNKNIQYLYIIIIENISYFQLLLHTTFYILV